MSALFMKDIQKNLLLMFFSVSKASHRGNVVAKSVFFIEVCLSRFLTQIIFWTVIRFHYRSSRRPATLLKKRLWHSCFPVNFAKFLRTPFLQNTSGRLLLYFVSLNVIPLYKSSCKYQHRLSFIVTPSQWKFG